MCSLPRSLFNDFLIGVVFGNAKTHYNIIINYNCLGVAFQTFEHHAFVADAQRPRGRCGGGGSHPREDRARRERSERRRRRGSGQTGATTGLDIYKSCVSNIGRSSTWSLATSVRVAKGGGRTPLAAAEMALGLRSTISPKNLPRDASALKRRTPTKRGYSPGLPHHRLAKSGAISDRKSAPKFS